MQAQCSSRYATSSAVVNCSGVQVQVQAQCSRRYATSSAVANGSGVQVQMHARGINVTFT